MGNEIYLDFYSVTISVANIRVMTNWYQDVLGFEKCSDQPVVIFDTTIQFLKLNRFRLELIECHSNASHERKAPPRHTETQGIANFCMQTSNLDGLAAALAENNVEVLWRSQNLELGLRMILIHDPERNLVQFVQEIKE